MTAQQIVALRSVLGWSQVQLASVLGVHPLTVSKWERGVLQPNQYQIDLMASFADAEKAKRGVGQEALALLLAAGAVLALGALLEAATHKKKRRK